VSELYILLLDLLFLILSAHPFCLYLAMIVWFITQEQMIIQVMLRMLRRRS